MTTLTDLEPTSCDPDMDADRAVLVHFSEGRTWRRADFDTTDQARLDSLRDQGYVTVAENHTLTATAEGQALIFRLGTERDDYLVTLVEEVAEPCWDDLSEALTQLTEAHAKLSHATGADRARLQADRDALVTQAQAHATQWRYIVDKLTTFVHRTWPRFGATADADTAARIDLIDEALELDITPWLHANPDASIAALR